jgi:hypothetical protein
LGRGMSADDVRQYFVKQVEPTFRAWNDDRLSENAAMSAAVNINHMIDHWWNGLGGPGAVGVYGTTSQSEFRLAVARHCDACYLTRDVADSHKHAQLDRKSRRLTRSSQTKPDRMGWGEAEWGVGEWGSPEELVIELDDGHKRHFSAVLEAAYEFWRRKVATELPT